MKIIQSITHFKKLCNINGFAEFYIILAGGFTRSWKRVHYNSEYKTFDIHNEIDDTWNDDITEKELIKITMIAEAIEKKALIYTGFQLNGIE